MINSETLNPTRPMADTDRANIVGLDVDITDIRSVVASLAELRSNGGGYVCLANVHMVMEARDNSDFRAVVNGADLVVPDGMPLVWMQKLLGRDRARRVRGNSLMIAAMKRAAEKGSSVGFYGSTPEVLSAINQRISAEIPDLSVTYIYSPPFRPLSADEDEQICDDINAAAPDILFVGLGCPKQEFWMADHRDKLSSVMVGVGAAFDFYSGTIPEAPEWMSLTGLEWFYRLTREPRRLWRRYLSTNPRFVLHAMLQLIQPHRNSM